MTRQLDTHRVRNQRQGFRSKPNWEVCRSVIRRRSIVGALGRNAPAISVTKKSMLMQRTTPRRVVFFIVVGAGDKPVVCGWRRSREEPRAGGRTLRSASLVRYLIARRRRTRIICRHHGTRCCRIRQLLCCSPRPSSPANYQPPFRVLAPWKMLNGQDAYYKRT